MQATSRAARLAAFLIAVLTGCTPVRTPAESDLPAGASTARVAETPFGAGGVIFPAELAHQVRYLGREGIAGTWTPDPEHIRALEARLAAALEAGQLDAASLDETAADRPGRASWLAGEIAKIVPELSGFRRQYFGIVDASGERRILVRCFPGPASECGFPFDRWRSEIVIVSDGGFWYWHVEYRPASGEFTGFRSNGYA